MHLAERMALPAPYVARPYRGPADHAAMCSVLAAYREFGGATEVPTVEQLDVTYTNLHDCDPELDIALVLADDEVVAYTRTSHDDLETGVRDCVVFAPVRPDHLAEPLWTAIVDANEAHMRPLADAVDRARYRAYAPHPGPHEAPVGEALWLEWRGYTPTEWSAALVRPDLDDIPERSLPDGVDVRPVTPEQIRPILEAHWEAFRGEWDFREAVEEDFLESIDHPYRDESLWKVAWVGDTVVGQVKPFINADENATRGYRRGYTEFISTHREWRNRGIAGALLAMSLHELRDRGMTQAALGVDTNNPGGAFELYTSLGFELVSYEAVYTRPVPAASGAG